MAGRPRHVLASLAAAAIAVVVMLIILASVSLQRYGRYMAGLWTGDPAFLKKAGLSDFQLFIAPMEGGRRQGYLLVADEEGGLIANRVVELREQRRRRWSALRGALSSGRDAYVTSFEVDAGSLLPHELRATFSILEGSLTLHTDEKVYAFLERSNAASSAAVEAYMATPAAGSARDASTASDASDELDEDG